MVCVLPVHQIRSHYGRDPVTVLAEDSSCTEVALGEYGTIYQNVQSTKLFRLLEKRFREYTRAWVEDILTIYCSSEVLIITYLGILVCH